jgi:hypothetical protein
LLSWNFLSASCTFWLTMSSNISMKFSLITCRISSFRCSCGLHWIPNLPKQRLCRAGEHGPVKWSSCRATQALGAWSAKQRSCRAREHGPVRQSSRRAVHAWGTWPGGDRKCLWIPGLKGLSHGDPAGLSV